MVCFANTWLSTFLNWWKNFTPKPKKNRLENWDKKNPERNFNIDFTSSRCKKIEQKFRRLIKLKTADFNVSFSWKTVKLARLFTPQTKPITNKLDQSGCIYDYVCFCSQEYLGKSKLPLKDRLKEHQYKSRHTAIYSHTSICP